MNSAEWFGEKVTWNIRNRYTHTTLKAVAVSDLGPHAPSSKALLHRPEAKTLMVPKECGGRRRVKVRRNLPVKPRSSVTLPTEWEPLAAVAAASTPNDWPAWRRHGADIFVMTPVTSDRHRMLQYLYVYARVPACTHYDRVYAYICLDVFIPPPPWTV